jgi:hypothetical protein
MESLMKKIYIAAAAAVVATVLAGEQAYRRIPVVKDWVDAVVYIGKSAIDPNFRPLETKPSKEIEPQP